MEAEIEGERQVLKDTQETERQALQMFKTFVRIIKDKNVHILFSGNSIK